MDRLFIDCNILIDWLTDRQPFAIHASKLLALIERRHVTGCVSPLTLSNTYYILRKQTGKSIATNFLRDAGSLFEIVDITRTITLDAIENRYKDFEDDLHFFTAINNKIDYIITRNKADFKKDEIRVLTAEEYLQLLL